MVMPDVVEEILLRSAVKDLIPWKTVCKSWYSLISLPSFAKSHLKHSINNDANNNITRRIAMPTFWKIPNERTYQFNIWTVVGSCNGLVCISPLHELYEDFLIVVNNPLTREVRELPMPPIIPKNWRELHLSFGYSLSTDDYTVVMGVMKKKVGALVQVFSFKTNTWKFIGHIKYWFNCGGILLNGVLHWFAMDCNTKEKVILSFDLSTEEFKVIPQPNDSRYVVNLNNVLGILENHLCIAGIDNHFIIPYDIWILRNYKSWELLPNAYNMKRDVVHYMKIYDFTSPQKKRMSFCCNDSSCLSRFARRIDDPVLFVQSLVSPYVNSERPSHAGSEKVAEQELSDFERAKKSKFGTPCEEALRAREKVYNMEGGDNEKFYWHQDGEGRKEKRKERLRKSLLERSA